MRKGASRYDDIDSLDWKMTIRINVSVQLREDDRSDNNYTIVGPCSTLCGQGS
ncbi:hypothetical protein SAMN04487896_0217 [Paenibacillus sp. ov031]|nr:hypothetical protein SAMN03159332_0882 [Paenibacillus sp. 276b]SHN52567.1 hypothetical protein SAMN04487896_0217 [Paenibacillus sp. ov031]